MIYREAGDFKTSYRDDSQTFPIRLDRWGYYAILAVASGSFLSSSTTIGPMRCWCPS